MCLKFPKTEFALGFLKKVVVEVVFVKEFKYFKNFQTHYFEIFISQKLVFRVFELLKELKTEF